MEVNVMTIDPVCAMRVEEHSAAATSEHGGKRYYFCSPGCKAAFDKNPQKYVGARQGPESHDHHEHHRHG